MSKIFPRIYKIKVISIKPRNFKILFSNNITESLFCQNLNLYYHSFVK